MIKDSQSQFDKLSSDYWLNKISSYNPEYVNGTLENNKIKRNLTVVLPFSDIGDFKKVTGDNPTSAFVVFLSVYTLLLKRYFGYTENLIAAPAFDMNNQDGFTFFKTSFQETMFLKEQLNSIKEEVQDSLKYESVSTKHINERLALYNTNLDQMLQYGMLYDKLHAASSSMKENADFVIEINTLNDQSYSISITYTKENYGVDFVNGFLSHFAFLLKTIKHNLGLQLSEIDIFSDSEKKLLVEKFNSTAVAYPRDKTLIDLFEEQVERTPDSIAVASKNVYLSYRHLLARVNQLAHYLREDLGVQENDFVGLMLGRSEELVISILAILKAGGAYIPIDINYPTERISFMFSDSGIKALITEGNVDIDLSGFTGKILILDKERKKIGSKPEVFSMKLHKPENIVYVIYTSGSTGKPKGVMVRHGGFTNLLHWYCNTLEISFSTCILLIAPISFDLAQKNIFACLIRGGKLYLSEELHGDYISIASVIKKQQVTIINSAPSAFYPLLDNNSRDDFEKLSSLTHVVLGGEPILLKQFLAWHESGYCHADLINSYGPTECTDVVSYYNLPKDKWKETKTIPIGKPIDNTLLYILDENLTPQPVGVSGEIYISGVGVSAGYLNGEDLTKERFISNPFVTDTQMYKTGDLGYWLIDGNIEYIGRGDNQVKIRGFRIELGEIENTLLQHEKIKEAVVIARENESGEKYLVGYFVSEDELENDLLKEYLASNLPDYMIPALFVKLEKFPLTPSGKLDRKSLASLEVTIESSREYIGPRNETEEKLVKIWEEVLGVDKIGIKDNFFSLGGHSLKVVQLASRIQKELKIKIDVKLLFGNLTVADQSRVVLESHTSNYKNIPIVRHADGYPLSHAQMRMWILGQVEESSLAYNISGGLQFEGVLNEIILKESLQYIVNRHESLRSVFRADEENIPQQIILDANALLFNIQYSDLSDAEDLQSLIDALFLEEQRISFDLSQDPLFRFQLIKLSERRHLLFFTLHHIISDGWSMQVLLQEVISVYSSLNQGALPLLPELRIQYKDYSSWQEGLLSGDSLKESRIYWLNQFAGELPILDLPTDHIRPLLKTYNGSVYERRFGNDLTSKLKAICLAKGSTLFMGLMASLNTLFYRYTGQEDIIIGSPVAGRDDSELENQVGLYLNTLALRTQFSSSDSFSTLLCKTRDVMLDAYAHQFYPLDILVNELSLKRDMSRSLLFDVVIILQSQSDLYSANLANVDGLLITPLSTRHKNTSQFDLTFDFIELNEDLLLRLNYNTDIYEEATIERMSLHLEQLLVSALNSPEVEISKLDYLSEWEKRELLEKFNATAMDYPAEKTLVDLFEEQVAKTPDAIAVVFENISLTYRELNERSNQLANYLLGKHHIEKGTLVGVKLARNEWMIIGILSVLKSGCVYVPIDDQTPDIRKDYILTNSGCKFLLDQDFILSFQHESEKYSLQNPGISSDYSGVFAVIYTTGSTGVPKGIELQHSNILNRLYWMWEEYPFTENEVCSIKTSISFVDHLWELFGPLLKGIKSIVFEKELILDTPSFISALSDHKISRIVLVPSLLKEILSYDKECKEKLGALKYWTCSGETLSVALVNAFYETFTNHKLFNIYGSTEVTADATFYDTAELYHNKSADHPALFQYSLDLSVNTLLTDFDKRKIIKTLTNKNKFQDVSLDNRLSAKEYTDFLQNDLLPEIVNVTAPKFIGHMTGPVPSLIKELNEFIVSINQNLVKEETSGVGILVERQVLGIFHKLVFNFPKSFYQRTLDPDFCLGIITGGGTLSNITALSYALAQKLEKTTDFNGVAEEGLLNALKYYGYKDVKIIGPTLCHYSIGKALKILGLGKKSFVHFNLDKENIFESKKELISLVERLADSGTLILSIIGVAGATETGSVDCLSALGEVANQYNIHYHVDAAFGGTYLFSENLSYKLKGIELADSVAICGHKQLYLPMGLSVCVFKDAEFAKSSENNTYYQARKGSEDLGKYTVEGSRSFMSLILHGALKIVGAEGYGEITEQNFYRAQLFAELIKENKRFQLFAQPELNIVLYRFLPNKKQLTLNSHELGLYLNDINRRIQKAQFQRGESFVSYTEIVNKDNFREVWFRTVLMNPNTTKKHLLEILEEQEKIGEAIEQDISTESISLLKKNIHIPIGKPIWNTQIYILDSSGQLCPVGVTGEICIGGEGLSRGYLNQPELTSEKFVANPFKAGDKLYRTGDLGKWLSDGNIEYLGRIDHQVKIRGHRIELGEIEYALMSHENIREAVVVAREDNEGSKYLVGYYVSIDKGFNVDTLRNYLGASLPDYMVPGYLVELTELPLTHSGKIDSKSLPIPELSSVVGTAYVAPRNEREAKLVKIWEEVLNREKIGVQDNFFALGGHSLKVIQLVTRMQKELEIKVDVKSLFTHLTIESQSVLLKSFKDHSFESIPSIAISANYVLSHSQQRLWVVSQFEESSAAYNVLGGLVFEGVLDHFILERSLTYLISRHESLRTVFREVSSGNINQIVLSTEETILDFRYEELNNIDGHGEEITKICLDEQSEIFDLSAGPLFRLKLIKLEENSHILFFTLHHIICDGWSMQLLLNEVVSVYGALVADKVPALTPLRIQYKDYAYWQRNVLDSGSLEESQLYWASQLEGEIPVLNLASDYIRPVVKTYEGSLVQYNFSIDITSKLKDFCLTHGSTLFMGLLASLNALFYRYTGQEDIIIGSPIAGRNHPELESQVGLYLNTLPLRTRFSGSESFIDLLSKTKDVMLDAYNHQTYPFDLLVEKLFLHRDMSRSPLFDVMVILQNQSDVHTGVFIEELEGLVVKPLDIQHKNTSQFDLSFEFVEKSSGLILNLTYNSDIYEASTITRLITHLEQLISCMLSYPDKPLYAIDYLSALEKNQLLDEFNLTAAEYPCNKTLIDLFESQVERTPDAIAVVFEDISLTYQELNERSNRLAHCLQESYNVKPDDLVGIKVARSEWMVICILAVLKAGGVYVPIDEETPQIRTDYILTNSGCKFLIDQDLILSVQDTQKKYSSSNLYINGDYSNVFAVIYTTGSTGVPKGIALTQANILNRLYWMWEAYPFGENEVCSIKTSIGFVDHLWELFGPLLKGTKSVIFEKMVLLDIPLFISSLCAHKISRIVLVPSLLKEILFYNNECKEQLGLLKYWTCSGEALPVSLVNSFYETFNDHKLFNIYGSTEVTADATFYDTASMDFSEVRSGVPIGRPIRNAQIYILDTSGELCPIGVVGEICVAGEGLSKGYLNNPDLTIEKFVENSFKIDERLYKTGDLGKWHSDGNIEYLGRLDHQVKIRGYRIELGEIECALLDHENIKEAVVKTQQAPEGSTYLVAYVVTRSKGMQMETLRNYLNISLPDYMIPTLMMELDALPLTSNGKIDRKSLPIIVTGELLRTAYVAPQNDIEEKLVKIWEEVLGIKNIGIHDNFFALGGHSLKVISVLSKIREVFCVKVGIKFLFVSPTIQSVAQEIDKIIWINGTFESNTTNEKISI